jgi:hypothetical protein
LCVFAVAALSLLAGCTPALVSGEPTPLPSRDKAVAPHAFTSPAAPTR